MIGGEIRENRKAALTGERAGSKYSSRERREEGTDNTTDA